MTFSGWLKFIFRFWSEDLKAGPVKSLFHFRRIWKVAVLLIGGATLIPLVTMALIDYNVTQRSVESEALMQTGRLVSNTTHTLSYFLEERKSALKFISYDNTFEELKDQKRLADLLENLEKGFGEGVALGVIDRSGTILTRSGSDKLSGISLINKKCLDKIQATGAHICQVFREDRETVTLSISVRYDLPDDNFYILRICLNSERFYEILSSLDLGGTDDAFIINHDGMLQMPSRYHGGVFEKILLPIPGYSQETCVQEIRNAEDEPLIVGYMYIPDSPFILMIVRPKAELMKSWYDIHMQLIGFLAASIFIVILVVLGVATFLVDMIYMADQKRAMVQHEAEYTSRMASIGRLAAGVAHEINNPLAVINEKAGLIRDLLTFKERYKEDEKLLKLADSVISSVDRCSYITKRLLSFARHINMSMQTVNLKNIISEVLEFLHKEAEYKSIIVSVDVSEDIPEFESDRGKLQQLFLNLINNAFAAMSGGGYVDIAVARNGDEHISVIIKDDGCGIPREDQKRIFEPFFSTRKKTGGTGLGLSITYGLVRELGGNISVQSDLGEGTTFTVVLPLIRNTKRSPA